MRVEIDWSKSPKSIVLIEDASDREGAGISPEYYCFAGSKCWRIGSSVNPFLSFRNASSASQVRSHFGAGESGTSEALGARAVTVFLSSSVNGHVIFAYFRMNHREKFANPRGTCISRTNFGVGQSSIVEIRSDSMPIASEFFTNPRKATCETPN